MYDPIPAQWLHLTMQGIGFTDEISRTDVDQVVAAARRRCEQLEPCTITIGPAEIDPEGLCLPVQPAGPLPDVRDAVRAAIAEVRGIENVPEAAEGYRPHVSLGHTNAAGPHNRPLKHSAAIHRTPQISLSARSR